MWSNVGFGATGNKIRSILYPWQPYTRIKHEVDWTTCSRYIIWKFQHGRSLKVTWRQTKTNIKNMSGQNLDIVLEYHKSSLFFDCMHIGGETLKSATFGPPWPWSWIGVYGIPSSSTHRPLPTYCTTKFRSNRKNFLWMDIEMGFRSTRSWPKN